MLLVSDPGTLDQALVGCSVFWNHRVDDRLAIDRLLIDTLLLPPNLPTPIFVDQSMPLPAHTHNRDGARGRGDGCARWPLFGPGNAARAGAFLRGGLYVCVVCFVWGMWVLLIWGLILFIWYGLARWIGRSISDNQTKPKVDRVDPIQTCTAHALSGHQGLPGRELLLPVPLSAWRWVGVYMCNTYMSV